MRRRLISDILIGGITNSTYSKVTLHNVFDSKDYFDRKHVHFHLNSQNRCASCISNVQGRSRPESYARLNEKRVQMCCCSTQNESKLGSMISGKNCQILLQNSMQNQSASELQSLLQGSMDNATWTLQLVYAVEILLKDSMVKACSKFCERLTVERTQSVPFKCLD
eukprot:g75825.t1